MKKKISHGLNQPPYKINKILTRFIFNTDDEVI